MCRNTTHIASTALLLALVTSGCWADFPQQALHLEAGAADGDSDLQVATDGQGDQLPDNGRADGSVDRDQATRDSGLDLAVDGEGDLGADQMVARDRGSDQQDSIVVRDSTVDSSPDRGLDLGPDQPAPDQALADLPPDLPVDSAPDSGVDLGVDLAVDLGIDLAGDSSADQAVDVYSCTPNAFIRCKTTSLLEKCNSSGDALTTVDCSPNACNATYGRCDECSPSSTPFCKTGTTLQSCTTDGLILTVNCALGCQNGACCTNVDGDGYTNCQGDCNDGDANVRPNQTSFFAAASNSSFDYDCDTKEELESPDKVNCRLVSGSCVGAGWRRSSAVPGCGQSGTFFGCFKQGPGCNPLSGVQKTQRCR